LRLDEKPFEGGVREDVPVRVVRGLAVWSVAGVLAACSSAAGQDHPSPSPLPSQAAPVTAPAIPNGAYVLSISPRDVENTGNGHLMNLSPALIGQYVLTLSNGHYSVTRNGQSSVPKPPRRRQGREGAYARYGFWIFLGIPPVGEGTFSASPSEVTFHSREGACFQKGASPSLVNGRYRWTLEGGELTLSVAGAAGTAPASGDGCLGRSFVFSAHRWAAG
jgi:hypothetical protein